MTTDFRSVYATILSQWMGFADTRSILKEDFASLPVI